MRKCLYCGAGEIQDEAINCRNCGGALPSASSPAAQVTSGELDAEVARLMQTDRKVQAVKLVRQLKDLSLPEAMAYVESIGGSPSEESPEDDR